MNERIRELAEQAGIKITPMFVDGIEYEYEDVDMDGSEDLAKFAESIVKEMCDMMEQAEDDAYHCFEPSERPTEYIGWLFEWRERFKQQFGVKE